jgi:hypothetical protein
MAALVEKTHRIVAIPLQVDICQISAGGVREKMDEWCGQARSNVMAAVQQELDKRPMLNIKNFNEMLLSQDQRANLDQTRALFDAVSLSIVMHTYGGGGQVVFQEKVEKFEYSLGTEVRELSEAVDAMLFVKCYEHIPTTGKKAVETGKLFLGVLTGVIMPVDVGFTHLSMALVNAETGTIIWYNQYSTGGSAGLRNPIKATAIVQELFKGFPL